eukprot:COSAG03_NODE_16488_length_400_cov_1.029900_1_plen_38_part_10
MPSLSLARWLASYTLFSSPLATNGRYITALGTSYLKVQ